MKIYNAFVFVALSTSALAIGGGDCNEPSVGPDVIVGDLFDVVQWGTVGGVTAYSLGTDSCNVGDALLPWFAETNDHPLIMQNVFRIHDGRIEQIGMSWLKHGFGALALGTCCACQNPGTTDFLGVGCSDPYCADLNGNQGGFFGIAGLGPRSDVNPTTGMYPFPYTGQGSTGDALFKRIQIANDDLDPGLNPGAVYVGEGHYISPHDAAAGNLHNNASYRRLVVTGPNGGGFGIALAGTTQRTRPAILAWQDVDPSVTIDDVIVDGRFILGSDASDNGNGTWRYEYALYNMNSHRSGSGFAIPVPPGANVSNVAFKDIAYHSGEPYDGTDWSPTVLADRVEWGTDSFAQNANANALRFGTLYNFSFDADVPPGPIQATITLFRPGAPDVVSVGAVGPVPPCSAVPYCVGAPNSAGSGASITASGTTGIAANDLVLSAAGAVPNQFGVFFYGPEPAATPFADGTLCVGQGAVGLVRLERPVILDGSGAVDRPLDYNEPPADSGPSMITAGSVWFFQLWYRDPLGPGGTGSNLSNGLQVEFCP